MMAEPWEAEIIYAVVHRGRADGAIEVIRVVIEILGC